MKKIINLLFLITVLTILLFIACPNEISDNAIKTTTTTIGITLLAPTNVIATPISSNIITIVWNPVYNAIGYEIYRLNNENGTYGYLNNSNDTFYTDSELLKNTTYYYMVKAYNIQGEYSDFSFYCSATTNSTNVTTTTNPIDIITAPTNLILGTVTFNSVSFSWGSVTNATGYEVYQSDTYNGTYSKIENNIEIVGTNCLITGLIGWTTYYFKVIAIGSGIYSNSSLSNYIEATTGKIQLAKPVGLTVETITNNSVNLSWNSVDNASSYEVYQYNSLTGEDIKVTTNINITGTTATITRLYSGTTYYFKVRAIGIGIYSNSQYSDYIGSITEKIQLTTPVGLTTGVITSDSVSFSWDVVANASYYEVYKYNTYNETYSKIETNIIITGTNATISGLAANTTYYFKVIAIGSGGYSNSELSDYIETTTGKIQLAIPAGLTLGTKTFDSVSLSWNSVFNATNYEVYQSNTYNGTYSKIETNIIIVGTNAIISGLNAYTTYYFKIMAVGSGAYSNSLLSTYIDSTTGKMQLTTPVGLTTGVITSNSITLLWDVVANASSYEVHQSSSSNGTYNKIETNIEITGNSATINGLNANITYYFKVIAIGSGSYSNSELSGIISATTGKMQLDTPTGLTTGTKTSTSVNLLWNNVVNTTGYEVHLSIDNLIYTKITNNITITGTNATINGLTANTTYYFKVIAVGSGVYSNSLTSDYIEVTTEKIQLATPINLTVGVITHNSVNLLWNSVDNATSYEVHRSNTYNGTYSKIETNIDITGTNTTISGLTANTTYYFKVMAVGSGVYSNSLVSNYIEFKTKIQLATPTNLMLRTVTNNFVNLSWNSVVNANDYEVYKSDSSGGTYTKITTNITITGTDAIITGLNEGITYYFKVIAIGNEVYSNSLLSTYIEATTKIQLAIPTNLILGTKMSNSVSFSWDSVDKASGYEVYKSNTYNGTYSKIETNIEIDGTNVTIMGLDSGTTYYFKVIAVGSGAYLNSLLSAYIEATTEKIQLTAPIDLTTGVITYNSITLSWSNVSSASSYEVHKSGSSGGIYSKIETNINITGNSATISGLYPNTTYYFKVISVGSSGYSNSPLSTYIEATTKIQLDTPTNLILGSVTLDSVSFSWDSVYNATVYEIYKSNSSNGIYSKIEETDITITGTNVTITGLSMGTTYYFKVIAIGDYSDSSLSTYIEATTGRMQLATPINLTIGTITDNSVNLSWNSVSNASGYEVYQSTTSNGTYSKITTDITITGTTVTAKINGLTPITTYYFKVVAVGIGAYSDSPLSTYIEATTGVATPTGLTLGKVASSSVSISWNSVANASDYEVYRSNSSGGTYSRVTTNITTNGTTVTAKITGLNKDTTYYFKVRAIGSLYPNSELSAYISARTVITRTVKVYTYNFWDGYPFALKINVNGVQFNRISSGGTYSFDVDVGDLVQFYWGGGSYQDRDAFIVYYADTPPIPEFNNYSWYGQNALLYKVQGTSGISDNTLLGSFTVQY